MEKKQWEDHQKNNKGSYQKFSRSLRPDNIGYMTSLWDKLELWLQWEGIASRLKDFPLVVLVPHNRYNPK